MTENSSSRGIAGGLPLVATLSCALALFSASLPNGIGAPAAYAATATSGGGRNASENSARQRIGEGQPALALLPPRFGKQGKPAAAGRSRARTDPRGHGLLTWLHGFLLRHTTAAAVPARHTLVPRWAHTFAGRRPGGDGDGISIKPIRGASFTRRSSIASARRALRVAIVHSQLAPPV